jgi:hypothetical protein
MAMKSRKHQKNGKPRDLSPACALRRTLSTLISMAPPTLVRSGSIE